MELRVAESFRSTSFPRPPTVPCPECKGRGYITIEIREYTTVWEPEYPVTVPVTCYRTRPCWRCHGRKLVREEGR
jgi:DnaJ-class molecular chaperone